MSVPSAVPRTTAPLAASNLASRSLIVATEVEIAASASMRTVFTAAAAPLRLAARSDAASIAVRARSLLSGWLAAACKAALSAPRRAAGEVTSAVSPTVWARFLNPSRRAALAASSEVAESLRLKSA